MRVGVAHERGHRSGGRSGRFGRDVAPGVAREVPAQVIEGKRFAGRGGGRATRKVSRFVARLRGNGSRWTQGIGHPVKPSSSGRSLFGHNRLLRLALPKPVRPLPFSSPRLRGASGSARTSAPQAGRLNNGSARTGFGRATTSVAFEREFLRKWAEGRGL
jgi:hypothetical protein